MSHKNGDGTQSTGTTSYAYYQNLVMVTDPKGRWTKFTMDAFGNLVQVEEPNPAGGTFFTYYTYDVLNHLRAGFDAAAYGDTDAHVRI